ncbi:MAG TPA: DUF58 domain-containing protein [Planctomicrobium sp.]|nr:DUF58 domain-containing protein [Planctomicrobium sp.]
MILPTRLLILLGVVPLLMAAVSGGSGVILGFAWGLMGGLLGLWLMDGIWFQPGRKLSLERVAPEEVYVDQQQRIEWILENRSSFHTFVMLRDQLPAGSSTETPELGIAVPRQTRTRLSYDLLPTVRGDLEFGKLYYRTLGALRLAWRLSVLDARQSVRCYPHLANWNAAEIAARQALSRQAGSHRIRWRGTGTIFESLREYTTEDDIRWVDWKASARAQRPITRNFETERHQQVLLIIDASRMMMTYCGHRTKMDTAIEAAILAARSAVEVGDAVGLLVFSDKIDIYLHPRREKSQVGAIMNALYTLHARPVEPDFETAITLAATRNRRRSLMLLFTDVTVIESSQRMSAYVRSLIPRHLPLVATIADQTVEHLEVLEPQSAEEFYQVGVANELLLQRDELLEVLRNSGAAVLDSPADEIATRTIETYLSLKNRMLL